MSDQWLVSKRLERLLNAFTGLATVGFVLGIFAFIALAVYLAWQLI